MALLARLFALLLLALAPAAFAQSARPDLYSVAGVTVDVAGANAAEARAKAFEEAEHAAFDRLLARLVPPQELAARGRPQPDRLQLARMGGGIDVVEEKRTGARYIGNLTVNFDPGSVRAYLRASGFNPVERRAPPTLLVAAAPTLPPTAQAAWRDAFASGYLDRELAPLAVAPLTTQGPPDWNNAALDAQMAGASRALYALARQQGASIIVDVIEVTPTGPSRAVGQLSAPVVGGEAGLPATFAKLAADVNARVQEEWLRAVSAPGAGGVRVAAVARYQGLQEWLRIKRGLSQAAASAVLAGVSIEAVATDGASLSFEAPAGGASLASALAQYGITVEGPEDAPILSLAG